MYEAFSILDHFTPQLYRDLSDAINLCRLRLNKTLQQDNIKIFEIPFSNILIVW
jgi:hypothetical protein